MLQFRAVTSLPVPSRHEEQFNVFLFFSNLSASRRLSGEETSRRSDLLVLPILPASSPGKPYLQDCVFYIQNRFSTCPVLSTGSTAIQPGSSWASPSSPLSPGHLTAPAQAPLSLRGDWNDSFCHKKSKYMEMEILKKKKKPWQIWKFSSFLILLFISFTSFMQTF